MTGDPAIPIREAAPTVPPEEVALRPSGHHDWRKERGEWNGRQHLGRVTELVVAVGTDGGIALVDAQPRSTLA